jgi:hypothetical protein
LATYKVRAVMAARVRRMTARTRTGWTKARDGILGNELAGDLAKTVVQSILPPM